MHLIALLNHGLSVGSKDILATHQAGNHHPARNQVRNILQHDSVQVLIFHRQAARFNFLVVGGNFCRIAFSSLVRVLPKNDSRKDHHQDDSDNAERICNSVPDTRQGGVHPGRGKG